MNNSNTELSDLKGKTELWKKVRSINFIQFQMFSNTKKNKIRISFPIIINTKNLMVEFVLKSQKNIKLRKDILICPACGKVVEDKYGICHMCGENVMQCRNCRNINYQKPDSFICVNCGFCKSLKYDIHVSAMMSFQHNIVDNERSKKICEDNIADNLK